MENITNSYTLQIALAGLAVAGTLLGAIVGAVLNPYLYRRFQKSSEQDRLKFEIYMMLMELYGYYFWVTVSEAHRKKLDSETYEPIKKLSWMIADKLRLVEDQKLVESLLNLLLADDSEKYPSALKRYSALGEILDEIGKQINPTYKKTVKKISEINIETRNRTRFRPIDENGKIVLNAPGSIEVLTFAHYRVTD